MDNLEHLLTTACQSVKAEVGIGKVADYIPALARISPQKFGASIATLSGETYNYGDAQEPFSIQSISKVFALTIALNKLDQQLWTRVGREPSGNAFNSIVQLENEQGIPRNPLINAGALVVADILLDGSDVTASNATLLSLVRELSGDTTIQFDEEVAQSEINTADRNAGLTHFMKSFGNITNPVTDVLDAYCRQCSIAMSCEQLAQSFLYLATNGINPTNNKTIISEQRARRINSIMLLCGHYDASGDFAFRVGLPGKSGVGGGIIVIIPDFGSIAVWSPCLNENGNSHAGTAALEAIVRATNFNVL